ncbi:hypothetical protein [Thalassomonas haliotis]|uniref:Uncharacterized protein n=1 Tax=Thalassomonas haliotis TaxID=485448 RepID=A0ABY7V6T3_9GAMM|nr:hypothetical protein [Thalassomonas haliotis]WDE09407.1 hypothetical protein H3N35_13775 [Thalassomonas haliotis]
MANLVNFVKARSHDSDDMHVSARKDSPGFDLKEKPWAVAMFATKKNGFKQAEKAVLNAIEQVPDQDLKETLKAICKAKMSGKDILHHRGIVTMDTLRSITAAYEAFHHQDAALERAINESKTSFSSYVDDHFDEAVNYKECVGKLNNTCQLIEIKINEIKSEREQTLNEQLLSIYDSSIVQLERQKGNFEGLSHKMLGREGKELTPTDHATIEKCNQLIDNTNELLIHTMDIEELRAKYVPKPDAEVLDRVSQEIERRELSGLEEYMNSEDVNELNDDFYGYSLEEVKNMSSRQLDEIAVDLDLKIRLAKLMQ